MVAGEGRYAILSYVLQYNMCRSARMYARKSAHVFIHYILKLVS